MIKRTQTIGVGLLLSALAILLVYPTGMAQIEPAAFRGGFVQVGASLPDYPVTENFNSIQALGVKGWVQQNNSTGPGPKDWFQGLHGVMSSHAGAPSSYAGANYQSTDGGSDLGSGIISNWLLTPEYTLRDGDTISFWTSTLTFPDYADRLQVRLSTSGASTNVGTLPTDTGDFSILLLDINPNYSLDADVGGYPEEWTMSTVTISGVGNSPTNGRIAFRYFVEGAGPNGINSNYIGIDSFEFTSEATAVAMSEIDASSFAYTPLMVAAVFFVLGVASLAVSRRDQLS